MKPRGKPIYSINEGNACLFDDAVTKYLESIKFPKVSRPKSRPVAEVFERVFVLTAIFIKRGY